MSTFALRKLRIAFSIDYILSLPSRFFYRLRWLVQKYLLKHNTLVRTIENYRMALDLKTQGISETLAITGSREEIAAYILKRELEPDMTVLDLGANIGYTILLEAKCLDERGLIFAVEPDPRNFRLLEKNVNINGLGKIVQLYQLAMAERSGSGVLHIAPASNLNTMVGQPHLNESFCELQVPVMSLDDFMIDKKPFNFLRMDIEGYEVEVLRGAMKTLSSAPGPVKIFFEAHPQFYSTERNITTVLEDLFNVGYRPKYLVSAGTPRPELFRTLGYSPDSVMTAGNFRRGIYSNVKPRDFIRLVANIPKTVRYAMIERSS